MHELLKIRDLRSGEYIQTSGDIRVELTNYPVMSGGGWGDETDTNALFSSLYSELHRLAKRQLAYQWSPLRLGVTTLLHEAYLNIAVRKEPASPDQARFMGYAARD